MSTANSTPEAKAVAMPSKVMPSKTIAYPFWFGGSASSMAACVTHPLDLIKVRLQTQPSSGPRLNMLQMCSHVVKTGGIQGLYSGISASLLRQMTYSTARFGVYEQLKIITAPKAQLGATQVSQQQSLPTLIALASTSGLIGGIAGNPADVLNVRMQHDAALPAASRRNYKNVLDGLVRMTAEEGPLSLFRGLGPNCCRAVLMTTSQLATYDGFKAALQSSFGMPDSLTTHFSASLLAGFVATTVCSPFDVIKTRMMSASAAPATPTSPTRLGASMPSSGAAPGPRPQSAFSIFASVYRAEGLTWVFRGWVPSFIRLGPQTIFTFLFLEQHKKLYRQVNEI